MDTLLLGAAIAIAVLASPRARRDFAEWMREDNSDEWLRAAIGAYLITSVADAAVSDPSPTLED